MDETPLYMDMPHNTTLAERGTQSIEVVTSGNEKSRFTVCLTITADGRMLPAYILFKNLVKVPKVNCPDNVVINVNKSGTMNEFLICGYLQKILKTEVSGKECVLLMDEFKAHFTTDVSNEMKSIGINHQRIPGGFTSTLQPLDVSINKPFKQYYQEQYYEWLDSENPIFTKSGNRQKPSYQCLVDMVSKAVSIMETQTAMINKSFVTTGIIQRGLLKKEELNYRLKEFITNDEDWDAEQDFIEEIASDYNGDDEYVHDEIVEESGSTFFNF